MNATRAPRLGWIGRDGRLIIAARTLRSFAQASVMLVIAIYLALRGFSLVEIGLVLSLGSVGAATSAVVIGLCGDTWGRRRALVVLGVLMSLTGIVLATSDAFVVLAAAAFFGSVSALGASGGGMGTLEQSILAGATSPAKRTDLFAFARALLLGGALRSRVHP